VKPGARASARLHPRRTTCAQFPPLWGNTLTSEISQIVKKGCERNRSLILPTRTPGPSGGQPHYYQSLYDNLCRKCLSTLCYRPDSNWQDRFRRKPCVYPSQCLPPRFCSLTLPSPSAANMGEGGRGMWDMGMFRAVDLPLTAASRTTSRNARSATEKVIPKRPTCTMTESGWDTISVTTTHVFIWTIPGNMDAFPGRSEWSVDGVLLEAARAVSGSADSTSALLLSISVTSATGTGMPMTSFSTTIPITQAGISRTTSGSARTCTSCT